MDLASGILRKPIFSFCPLRYPPQTADQWRRLCRACFSGEARPSSWPKPSGHPCHVGRPQYQLQPVRARQGPDDQGTWLPVSPLLLLGGGAADTLPALFMTSLSSGRCSGPHFRCGAHGDLPHGGEQQETDIAADAMCRRASSITRRSQQDAEHELTSFIALCRAPSRPRSSQ